jgi:hypothetical protein
METMTPFAYVEFYDVPRTIILPVREKWILLRSAFNENLDDYEAEYSVYQLPSPFEPPTKGSSWKFVEETELIPLGKIPVHEVKFDSTKRRTLSAAALDVLVPD